MKNLLFLVIVMMTLSIADSFAQNIHYQLDKKGELYVVPDSAVKNLQITFKANVPDSIKTQEKILTQLHKTGKYELSSKQIRGGKFEGIVVWYIPRYDKKVLTSSMTNGDHMLVSYDEYKEFGIKVFNWISFLCLCALLLILLLYVRQRVKRSIVNVAIWLFSFFLGVGLSVVIGISMNVVIGIICGILAAVANYIVWGIGKEDDYLTSEHHVYPTITQKVFLGVYIAIVLSAGMLAYYYGIGITPP